MEDLSLQLENLNLSGKSPETSDEESTSSSSSFPELQILMNDPDDKPSSSIVSGRFPNPSTITPSQTRFPMVNHHYNDLPPLNFAGARLNLDCTTGRETSILGEWKKAMINFFAINKYEASEQANLLFGSFQGNVQNWWEGLSSARQNQIRSTFLAKLVDAIEEVEQIISLEFIVDDWKTRTEHARIRERERSLRYLHGLAICKMKYYEDFKCQFANYYY